MKKNIRILFLIPMVSIGIMIKNTHGSAFSDSICVAARSGDIHAMAMLGSLYYTGYEGMPVILDSARVLLDSAMAKFDPIGYFYGALMERDGKGMKKDTADASAKFAVAVYLLTNPDLPYQSMPDCQDILGRCYFSGLGVQQNVATGIQWLEKSASRNFARAAYRLSDMYHFGFKVPVDVKKSAAYLKQALDGDYPCAQRQMGFYCLNGNNGMLKDTCKGVAYFRKAAGQNDALSQIQLATILRNGICMPRDTAASFAWYAAAARQGDTLAQFMTGYGFLMGLGCLRNNDSASYYLKLSARKGHAVSNYLLGINFLLKGQPFCSSAKEAVECLYNADNAGDSNAGAWIGYCLYSGIGAVKDTAHAVQWLRKAAAKGSKFAEFQIGRHFMFLSGYRPINQTAAAVPAREPVLSAFRIGTDGNLHDIPVPGHAPDPAARKESERQSYNKKLGTEAQQLYDSAITILGKLYRSTDTSYRKDIRTFLAQYDVAAIPSAVAPNEHHAAAIKNNPVTEPQPCFEGVRRYNGFSLRCLRGLRADRTAAMKNLTGSWLPIETKYLQNGDVIEIYGVGDKGGHFGARKGEIITFLFQYENDSYARVGIKVNSGNPEAEDRIHANLQNPVNKLR